MKISRSCEPYLGCGAKICFLAGAMGQVEVLISKVFTEVEKVMVVVI
jgi:hypothetical protein